MDHTVYTPLARAIRSRLLPDKSFGRLSYAQKAGVLEARGVLVGRLLRLRPWRIILIAVALRGLPRDGGEIRGLEPGMAGKGVRSEPFAGDINHMALEEARRRAAQPAPPSLKPSWAWCLLALPPLALSTWAIRATQARRRAREE